MQAFDASSMVYAWDNYPIDQIPGLWSWMEREIKAQEFVISQVAFEEVGHKLPECLDWLKNASIARLAIENEMLNEAIRMKALLGIEDEKYAATGVDENDLLIIACARVAGCRLISEEAVQNKRPMNKAKYNEMSAAQKKVIDDHCTPEWAERVASPWADYEAGGRDKLRNADVAVQGDLAKSMLGIAAGRATVYGCDLSDGYVRINADYTT